MTLLYTFFFKICRYTMVLTLFAVWCSSVICEPLDPKPLADPLTDPLVSVNKTVITRKSLQWIISHVDSDQTDLYAFEEKILDQLINRELLYQESLENEIAVSNTEIRKQLNRLAKSLKTNRSSFRQELGLSAEEINDELRKDIGIKKLLNKELRSIKDIPTEEINDYYQTHSESFLVEGPVFVRHILIKVDPDAEETIKAQALEKIEAILAQLKTGADFSVLAKNYSECPSRIKGGDVGLVHHGQKHKSFENAVFSLEVGEISNVVTTSLGYHLITVTGKQPVSFVEFEKVEKRIKQFLIKEKKELQIKELVENLRQTSEIKIYMQ